MPFIGHRLHCFSLHCSFVSNPHVVENPVWHFHISTVLQEAWSRASTVSLFWWFATCTSFGMLTLPQDSDPNTKTFQMVCSVLLIVSTGF
jgi:hypothetical protein